MRDTVICRTGHPLRQVHILYEVLNSFSRCMNMENIIDGSRVVVRGPHFVPTALSRLVLEDYHFPHHLRNKFSLSLRDQLLR